MHVPHMPRPFGIWFEPEFTLLAQTITFYGTEKEVEAILEALRKHAMKMIERGAPTRHGTLNDCVDPIGHAAE